MKDIFYKIDVQYPEKLPKRHNDLPFLPETLERLDKLEKLVANLHDKFEYVIYIRF